VGRRIKQGDMVDAGQHIPSTYNRPKQVGTSSKHRIRMKLRVVDGQREGCGDEDSPKITAFSTKGG